MDSCPLSEFLCSPRPWIRTWRTGSPGSQCHWIWAELSELFSRCVTLLQDCPSPGHQNLPSAPQLPYPQPGSCFHALLTKLHEGFDFLQRMPSKSSKTSSVSLSIPPPSHLLVSSVLLLPAQVSGDTRSQCFSPPSQLWTQQPLL